MVLTLDNLLIVAVKYDILALYGGGVNCYHFWERRIFKKKRQEDGSNFIKVMQCRTQKKLT